MFEKPKRQFSAVLGGARDTSYAAAGLRLTPSCSRCARLRPLSGQPTAPSDEWIVTFGTCPLDRSAIFVDGKRRRPLFFQFSTVLPRRTNNALPSLASTTIPSLSWLADVQSQSDEPFENRSEAHAARTDE